MSTSLKSTSLKDNFYHAINEKWLNDVKIPKDRTSWNNFSVLHEQVQNQLKKLINSVPDDETIGRIKLAYAARKSSVKQIDTMLQIMHSTTDMWTQIGIANVNNIEAPLIISIRGDQKDSNSYCLYGTQGGLTLPNREYYDKDGVVRSYDSFLTKLIPKINRTVSKLYKIKSSPAQIIEFEKQMSKQHLTPTELRDVVKTYNPITIETNKNVCKMLHKIGITKKYYDRRIILDQESYIDTIDDILSKTNKTVWKDYLTIKTFYSYANDFGTSFDKLYFEFFAKELRGQEKQISKWKQELRAVQTVAADTLDIIYRKMHFQNKKKKEVIKMTKAIQKEVEVSIQNNTWMSNETKTKAIRKLSSMKTKIGYYDRLKPLQLPENITTYIEMLLYCNDKELKKLLRKWKSKKTVDKKCWYMQSYEINAYYSPMENEIVFPAAILQAPFFDTTQSVAQNFGGIGAVIGHEITHAFDDQGCMFDHEGNMNNWWTESDKEQYDSKTKVIEKQFSKHKINGISVNGALTLGENIADIGGFTLSYTAMLNQSKVSDVLKRNKLKQEFMKQWAVIWRGKTTPQATIERLTTDPHSPGEVRVNGVLAFIDDFYTLFDVTKQCSYWIDVNKRVKLW